MLTEKENFLRLLRGEMPEFLPRYDLMHWNVFGSPYKNEVTPEGIEIDEFGLKHKTSPESMGGFMPLPGFVLLDDITKWRDIIKTPDTSKFEWEAWCKEQLKDKDTVNNPVSVMIGDYFMKIVNFMSVTEGLIALYEEPEECYALCEYLSDYYVEVLKNEIYYFKPDVLHLADDVAAGQMPFIDLETYRKVIKPHHKRLADIALDNGMLISMHCCGKCEMFLDDFIDLGVTAWEPAQVSNDLLAIKKKYGPKLAIMGGWDNTGPISMPETSDEELRDALVHYVDTFAPGGGFADHASVATGFGEEEYKRKMAICDEVYNTYARDWYKNHAG